ncbi:MAG: hypothetical protein M3443_15895 [Actinomycetota bacterium]|nr:hypothetical protein [Actinomycetota bacterium]
MGFREKRSDGELPAHVIMYLTLALCLSPTIEPGIERHRHLIQCRGDVRTGRPRGELGDVPSGVSTCRLRAAHTAAMEPAAMGSAFALQADERCATGRSGVAEFPG